MEKIDRFFGSVVEIETNEGAFTGTIRNIDVKDKKIILTKVKNCATGEMFRRDVHFCSDQIHNLKLSDKNIAEIKKDDDGLPNEVKSIGDDVEKPDLRKAPAFMDASDEGPSLTQINHIHPSAYLSGLECLPLSQLNEPPRAVLINLLNQEFEKAVSDIKQQKVISFIAEGKQVNRFGRIDIATFATRKMVYIFDLWSMKCKDFPPSLKVIVEDVNILKVVHDVRLTSDCLYHCYDVRPKNIFDTQVADAFIRKQHAGEFPSKVADLTSCVSTYLGVTLVNCSFEREKRELSLRCKNIWKDRPIEKKLLSAIAKAAMYLRELRCVMLERLLAEYLYGVDLYLGAARDMNDNVLRTMNSDKLPQEFQRMANFKQKRASRYKKNYHSQQSDHKDSCDEVRGVWDVGEKFHDEYQKKHGTVVECMGSNEIFDLQLLRSKKKQNSKYDEMPPQRLSDFQTTSDSDIDANHSASSTDVKGPSHKAKPSECSKGPHQFDQRVLPYDENFPSLTSSVMKGQISERGSSEVSSNDDERRVKRIGRGKHLKTIRSSLNKPPANTLGTRKIYDFPSDEELLNCPQVMPLVETDHVGGQTVTVLMKH